MFIFSSTCIAISEEQRDAWFVREYNKPVFSESFSFGDHTAEWWNTREQIRVALRSIGAAV
jgi:hypothetical protein